LPDLAGGLSRGPARDDDRLYARVFYNRDRTEANLAIDDTGADFRHDTGFVGQSGVRRLTAWLAQGFTGVPGLNEFWVNTEAWQVRDRVSGDLIEEHVRPGVWMTAARNLEAWVEWHGLARQRLAPGAPMLSEQYLSAGMVMTPGAWWHFVDVNLSAGRLVDAGEGIVRPGRQFYAYARLRPLPRLEVEPTWSMADLHGEGRPRFRETAAQALVVWHLGARSYLRAILQRSTLERGGQRLPASSTTSLTWSHRHSAGTVLYVGASRSDDGGGRPVREAFVKLQLDTDDALTLF
jgi:hypothetical protein